MRILTLNCCGVPLVSFRPKGRIKHIASHIQQFKPDIICFQEVYTLPQKQALISALSSSYPHYFVPRSGLFLTGGGLCFFSRFPIKRARFQRFSVSGHWTNWTWVYKINAPGFMEVELEGDASCRIFHSYLSCNFSNEYDPKKSAQARLQVSQLEDVASAIKKVSKNERCLIVGDLNVPAHTGIFKSFIDSIGGCFDLTLTEEPSLRETLRGLYRFPDYFSKILRRGKIDYVLSRGPAPAKSSWKYICNEEELFSDHFGIITDIDF